MTNKLHHQDVKTFASAVHPRGNKLSIVNEVIEKMCCCDTGDAAIAVACEIFQRVWGWTEENCIIMLKEILYDAAAQDRQEAVRSVLYEIESIDISSLSEYGEDGLSNEDQNEVDEIESLIQQAEDSVRNIANNLPESPIAMPANMERNKLYIALCNELLLRARFHPLCAQITFNTDDGKDVRRDSQKVEEGNL